MAGKAGDIFLKRDGSGEKATFSEVFPEIEALEADVTEAGLGNTGLGVRRFGRHSYREFVNCSNIACSGHGVPTGDILRNMMKARQTTYEDRFLCSGREESGNSCPNVFAVKISVRYKTS